MKAVDGHRSGAGFVSQFARPEYTGENRCMPCTVVNVIIALGISLALTSVSVAGALAAMVAMGGVIYFRGYLVPGTPTLTERYLPDRIMAWFDHSTVPDGPANLDPEALLADAGILVEDSTGADLELDPEFERRWQARFDAVGGGSDRAILAALTAVDPERLSVEYHDTAFVAWLDDRHLGQWESRVAFHADVAAFELLAEYVPAWESLPLAHRSTTLGVLRLFIERCPACDGVVAMETGVKRSCCRDIDVIATTCLGCGERLFEAEFDPASLEPEMAPVTPDVSP
jgi:hypothetical protein